jgi:protein gp37
MRGDSWWWDIGGVWNPIYGCFPISPGCSHCFAPDWIASCTHPTDAGAVQHGVITPVNGRWFFNGEATTLRKGHPSWRYPLEWPGAEKPKLGPGRPSLIFVCGMSDLFYEGQPDKIISRVCATIAMSAHIGELCTKRTVMADYFLALDPRTVMRWQLKLLLGFSAENQEWFDQRWPDMRRLAEAGWFIFVSIAPMIGPVRLPDDFLALGQRTWVVVSGEQRVPGTRPRPMKRQWVRDVRDQCGEAGVAFFFKQMSRGAPIPPDPAEPKKIPLSARTISSHNDANHNPHTRSN